MRIFENLFPKKQSRTPAEEDPKFHHASPIGQRLADEFAFLEEIEFQRNFRGDPSYRKTAEERIVWRELFDLELQELDQQNLLHMRQIR